MGSAIYVAITKQSFKPTSSSNSVGGGDSDEDIRIVDLELGVAEPERTRFLGGRRNGSAVSLGSTLTTAEERDTKERDKSYSPSEQASEVAASDGTAMFAIDDSESASGSGSDSGLDGKDELHL